MNWQGMLFQDWEGVIRTLFVGMLAYAVLVTFLRISGKRTLAKLNAFDLVVTVALGSTLSAILLQESIALAEGMMALGLLIAMQFLVAFMSVRWKGFSKIVRSEPSLLIQNGVFCDGALLSERVTRDEALGAVRSAGGMKVEDAAFVILESDGTMSVGIQSQT